MYFLNFVSGGEPTKLLEVNQSFPSTDKILMLGLLFAICAIMCQPTYINSYRYGKKKESYIKLLIGDMVIKYWLIK